MLVGGLLVAACSTDSAVRVDSSGRSAERRSVDVEPSVEGRAEPTASTPDQPGAVNESVERVSPDDPGSDSATFEALFARGRSDLDLEYTTSLVPLPVAPLESEQVSTQGLAAQPLGDAYESAATIMSMVAAPGGALLVGSHQEPTGTARAAIWNVDIGDFTSTEPVRLLGPRGSASVAEHAVVSNGLTYVVGHVGTPETATVWTIGTDETTETVLTAPPGALARRIAAGADGVLWVLGEQPGFAGQLLVWSSTDGGATWSDPYVEPVFQWINPYALAIGADLAVVSWDAPGATESGRYRLRTFQHSAGAPPARSGSEALEFYSDDLVDVRVHDGALQILEGTDTAIAVWTRTTDGGWEKDPHERGAMAPIAFGQLEGSDVFLQAEGLPYDTTVQVVTADDPRSVIAEMTLTAAFYTRFLEFPAVVASDRLLLLDPGTSDAPVLWSVGASGTTRTELDLAPHRRRLHDRVVDLAVDRARMIAVVDTEFEIAPGEWQPIGERLVVVDPELDPYPAHLSGQKVLIEQTSAGTVVGVAGGVTTEWYLVESFDPSSVPKPVGVSDGSSTRLVMTTDGAVTSTIDGRVFVSTDLVDWREVTAVRGLPGAQFLVEDVCTHDYVTLGIGTMRTATGRLEPWVMARTGSMWQPVYQSFTELFDGPAPARCALGENDLTIAHRQPSGRYRASRSLLIDLGRLATSPESAGAATSIPDDFADRFRDAGVTEIDRRRDGWLAVGGSLDPDGSEDAVLWLGDYQDPSSVITLASGPGLQEARALLVAGDAVYVGGTDNGVPTIWTLPLRS